MSMAMVTVVWMAMGCGSAASRPGVEDISEAKMAREIQSKFDGGVTVDKLEKTNGATISPMGMEMYQLSFQGRVTSTVTLYELGASGMFQKSPTGHSCRRRKRLSPHRSQATPSVGPCAEVVNQSLPH